ncbi:unnamed protein product [Spirodela intermedia]|uniref:Uncharacterized protein n=1 Tax=Spirodela intermedia TaxID=51605 RepID=A0A7I8IZL5_SPIIN|nr:unnamed protein product [Spirodela intermedia]CAA6662601.1 unnamed protein product [Spirodela intermedia]
MKKEALDLALVPMGLIILASYHVWLVRRVRREPTRTVMGINSINRRFWFQSLRNNIMASTLMASTAIMLSSVIAILMTNSGGWPSRLQEGRAKLVVGDASELGLTIKFVSILSCFLLAFLFEVQSVRYYSHSSILINVPIYGSGAKAACGGQELRLRRKITPEFVAKMLDKGNIFWSLGLRAIYFSFPLFLWIFGPVPMFTCCVVLVSLLYFLDMSSDEETKTGSTASEAADQAALAAAKF